MQLLNRLLLYYLFLFGAKFSLGQNLIDVDFLQSMTDSHIIAQKLLSKNPERYKFMYEQYEAKKPSKMTYSKLPLIPKVMHQIWDGPIPPLYKHYLSECKKLHPEWEFKIWDAQQIRELSFDHKSLYNKARNYQGRSDIARYEILYKFGGVYRDMDVKCIRRIDELNHKYDFYATLDMPTIDWQMILNNGIIGAKPSHPILKTTLELIEERFDKYWKDFDEGDDPIEDVLIMVAKSSMLPLGDAFVLNTNIHDKSIALPTTYFCGLSRAKHNTFWSGLKYMLNGNNEEILSAFNTLKPEALMHHNSFKQEILPASFDYGNGFYDRQVTRFFDALSPVDKRVMKTFSQVYAEEMPSKVTFNQEDKIPQVIHFITFNSYELHQLKQNLNVWQLYNPSFELRLWDKDNINSAFKETKISVLTELLPQFRLYCGLKILEKFGGSYADYKAIPHKPIFELNNKYNFYAGLMPLASKNSKILFSRKLIGASPNHPIISNTLEQVNLADISTLKNLDATLVNKAYKNLYLYDSINAKNIILPAIYFEPFAKLDTAEKLDKLNRFILAKPEPFSKLTDFIVVE